jgi:ABC-type dipeptide/oligopeptide/nickel transport system permease subunit
VSTYILHRIAQSAAGLGSRPAIVLVAVSFNHMGDALRDGLDVRLQQR